MKKLRLFAVLAFCGVCAHAGTILYVDSGTFSASTPPSAFSGANEAWTFSFQADTNPTPSDFGNGGFTLPFSSFTYTLNGAPVAITPSFVRFFSAFNGGGFELCFTPGATTVGTCPDALGTPIFPPSLQLYTGDSSAPTLISGEFTMASFEALVGGTPSAQANTTITGLLELEGGTTSAPFILPTSVGAVTGTISGEGSQDYYSFFSTGGVFSATATVSGAPSGASYQFSLGSPGTCTTFSTPLTSGDGFSGTISETLAPGTYCIGLEADGAADPTFSLIFNTPVSGAPEPRMFVPLLLLFGGVAAITAARRVAVGQGSRTGSEVSNL